MKKEYKQAALFEQKEWWEDDWQGMPEFVQEDQSPHKTLIIHFETRNDMNAFADLVKQKITMETKTIWYPKASVEKWNKRYVDINDES